MKRKLHLEKLDRVLEDGTELWLFIKHSPTKYSNYDLRWAIGYRERTNWWGVICLFPATHEGAIDGIKEEMELAKEAIVQLKGTFLV